MSSTEELIANAWRELGGPEFDGVEVASDGVGLVWCVRVKKPVPDNYGSRLVQLVNIARSTFKGTPEQWSQLVAECLRQLAEGKRLWDERAEKDRIAAINHATALHENSAYEAVEKCFELAERMQAIADHLHRISGEHDDTVTWYREQLKTQIDNLMKTAAEQLENAKDAKKELGT